TLRPWRTMRWSSANRMRNGTSRLLGVALARAEYAHHTGRRVPARRQGPKSGEVPNWAGKIPEGEGGSDLGRLGLDQATPNRVTDEARRLVDLELLHDPGPVGLRGLHADPEELGDLLGRLAFGHQLQHLPLARGERVGRYVRLGQVGLDHGLRDARAQVDHPLLHLVDRPDQVGRRLGLHDVALDAGAERLEHVVV